MTGADFRVRRATVDDLPALRELWKKATFAPIDLEKRFTELQIAETQDGKIAGALGLKIERLHGQIHSEVVVDPGQEEALREAFWQRVQVLSRNHGLFRLWTESTSPYWAQLGFKAPDAKELERMPPGLAGSSTPITYTLREESANGLSVEKEFELFTQAQKLETEQLMQQAQVFKKFAYGLLALLTGAVFAYAAWRFIKLALTKNEKGLGPGR